MVTFHNNRPVISTRLWVEIVITGGLILAIAIPRLLNLNNFVTTDERLWLERSGRFYYALAHHDFAATFQKSHPGVTVMWAGLAGYIRVFPGYYEDRDQGRPIGLSILQRREFDLPLRILVAGRQAMVMMHLVILVLSFLFARRLLGTPPALMGFLLIAFDPFHIALSRVLHLDGLLADLCLLSLLAFLVYLSEHNTIALLISSVAAGLAWLTKSPGLFLILPITLSIVLKLISLKNAGNNSNLRKPLLDYVKALAVWGIIAILVVFLLWPAMWVNPLDSVSRVINDAIGYAQGGHESAVFFDGKIYPDGEIPDLSFYPVSFLWRSTPVTLLGLLVMSLLFIGKLIHFRSVPKASDSLSGSPNEEKELQHASDRQRLAVVALLFLALGYGVLMTFGLKKFDRYILPSLVPLDLVAGVGLVWLVRSIGTLLRPNWKVPLEGMLALGFVAVQAALAWGAFPYFFNYYNPLLGGGSQAIKVMQIGWGEGLDQAARYINNKPNSEKIRVIAWYGSGPFSYFSKSRVSSLDVDHQWSAEDWMEFDKADYAVVYIHEWQRNLPAEILDRLRNSRPEYSVWIDGLEYVQVYKIH